MLYFYEFLHRCDARQNAYRSSAPPAAVPSEPRRPISRARLSETPRTSSRVLGRIRGEGTIRGVLRPFWGFSRSGERGFEEFYDRFACGYQGVSRRPLCMKTVVRQSVSDRNNINRHEIQPTQRSGSYDETISRARRGTTTPSSCAYLALVQKELLEHLHQKKSKSYPNNFPISPRLR